MKVLQTLLVGLFLTTAACVEVQDSADADQAPAAPAPQVLVQMFSDSAVQVDVEGLPEPQLYKVTLKWPAAQGAVAIYKNGNLIDTVSASDGTYSDQGYLGGQNSQYELRHLNSQNQLLAKAPLEVSIPEDVVWSGEYILNASREVKAHRFFLLTGTQVFTRNFNLTITAEEFYSDKSLIGNFKMTDQAPTNITGKNGGNISISASKAFGYLILAARGEQGGHGSNGGYYKIGNEYMGKQAYCSELSGANGGNGGNISVSITEVSDIKIIPSAEGGLAGNPGSLGDPRSRSNKGPYNPQLCRPHGSVKAIPGKPGSKGKIDIQ